MLPPVCCFSSLGGEIGSPDWAFPYLKEEHNDYAKRLLFAADALLLGRLTYEGLSAAYPAMTGGDSGVLNDFIERMNSIPKYTWHQPLFGRQRGMPPLSMGTWPRSSPIRGSTQSAFS